MLRSLWFLSLMALAVAGVLSGCAALRDVASSMFDTMSDPVKAQEALRTVSGWLPSPWNYVASISGTALALLTGRQAYKSVKNSPKGKVFGPTREAPASPK